MTDDTPRTRPANRLSRRALLATGGASLVALAGCTGDSEDGTGGDETPSAPAAVESPNVPETPEVEDPPEAVYVPTHREAMEHRPTVDAGDYAVTPMLTYPHKFWLVTGAQRETVSPDESGLHLMATVWDSETGAVLPTDMGLQTRVLQDGEQVDRRAPWPMISQAMGFHFGDNVGLPGPGSYTVEVTLNPVEARTTGAFADRFTERETVRFEFEFDAELRRSVNEGVDYFDESRWGERGAVEPMGSGDGMQMPYSALQPAEEYPGADLGTSTSGDARFVVRYLPESRLGEDGSGYLLVSPRTPYNRVPLADMALSAAGAAEGDLVQTLDSEFGHHYGLAADLSQGDEVTLTVESPPQVARHRGYETAFLDMQPLEVRLE